MNGLTRIQRRVARTVLATVGQRGFALAGGAGLVAVRLSERPTRGIDAFTADDVDVGAEAHRVAATLRADGSDVVLKRESSTFASMTVVTGSRRRSRIELDLARDAINWPIITTSLGPTLSPRELAANKVLALFGRVQTRDLADLRSLAGHFEIESMLIDAASKDAGLDRGVLAEMVRLVCARPDPEWPVGVDVDDLRSFGTWLADALESGGPVPALLNL